MMQGERIAELEHTLQEVLDWVQRESLRLIDRYHATGDIDFIPVGCQAILEHYGLLAGWHPPEWCYDESGQPSCTAFTERKPT